MHVAKTAAGYWDGLCHCRRLPCGLASLTCLAISAPVGDVGPHSLPKELVRYEAAGVPDARLRHTVQGGEYRLPVAGRHHRRKPTVGCDSGRRLGVETVQPSQGLLQPGTAIRSGSVGAGWSGYAATIRSGGVGVGWSGGEAAIQSGSVAITGVDVWEVAGGLYIRVQ